MNMISAESEKGADQVYTVCGDPGDHALEDDDDTGPFGSEFSLDRGDGCDTWCIEQTEDEKRHRGQWGQKRGDRISGSDEDIKCRYDALFCHEAADEGGGYLPVAKAQRCEYRCDETGYDGEDAVARVFYDKVETGIEGLQEPDHD